MRGTSRDSGSSGSGIETAGDGGSANNDLPNAEREEHVENVLEPGGGDESRVLTSPGTGKFLDGASESERHGGPGAHRTGESLRRLPSQIGVGEFVFFLATGAPFVVGKVIEMRMIDDVDEVRVQWFSPVSKLLRDGAAECSIEKYASATFRADYLAEREEHRGRPRLVPDVSSERVSRVVVSCDDLIGRGKKIPRSVISALVEASTTRL